MNIPAPKFAIGDFVTLKSIVEQTAATTVMPPVMEVKGFCVECLLDYQGIYYWVRWYSGAGTWLRTIEFGIGPKLQTGEFRLLEVDLLPCPQKALNAIFGKKEEDNHAV